MNTIRPERVTAEIDGDFVDFLIGMRINMFWKLLAAAMPRMFAELSHMPPFGLGRAGKLVPAQGRKASAKSRLGQPHTSDPTAV